MPVHVSVSLFPGLCVGIFLGVCVHLCGGWQMGSFVYSHPCLELKYVGPVLRRVWDSGEGLPALWYLLIPPSFLISSYSFSVLPSMTPAPFSPSFLPFS